MCMRFVLVLAFLNITLASEWSLMQHKPEQDHSEHKARTMSKSAKHHSLFTDDQHKELPLSPSVDNRTNLFWLVVFFEKTREKKLKLSEYKVH